MKNAGKARSYGLYRHLRTSKEIIENLLNYYRINLSRILQIRNYMSFLKLCRMSEKVFIHF